MRVKLLIITVLFVLVIGSPNILAQKQMAKEMKPSEGMMKWSFMVGSGFLHNHMNSMIKQMAGMINIMSRMMGSGKMGAQQMKSMAGIMNEMSTMMSEMPAVRKMMEKQPDNAMKDMGKMMKTMSGMMGKMSEMMAQMPK